MSEEAAQVEPESAEEAPVEVSESEEDLDFNIFEESTELDYGEVAQAAAESETASAEKEPDKSWTARVRKDREQRQQEIELKQKEQLLTDRETKVASMESARQALVDNPEEFVKGLGLDWMEVYTDWTQRMATGVTKPSEELVASSVQRELAELKAELAKRDQQQTAAQEDHRRATAIQAYYKEIEDFRASTNNYPLTKEQCTTEDIAQGIAAYHQKTGIQLEFNDAFKMVEEGLQASEEQMFTDPAVIAKFNRYQNRGAENRPDRRPRLTLSNTLGAQPTKTALEDMSTEEVMDHYKGKLFTD
jgi:hypothetical protein